MNVLVVEDDARPRCSVAGLGTDDYLTKPFAFKDLLTRIEALLRRFREQRPKAASLQMADLVLDWERILSNVWAPTKTR